jgi:hypothetical protein
MPPGVTLNGVKPLCGSGSDPTGGAGQGRNTVRGEIPNGEDAPSAQATANTVTRGWECRSRAAEIVRSPDPGGDAQNLPAD